MGWVQVGDGAGGGAKKELVAAAFAQVNGHLAVVAHPAHDGFRLGEGRPNVGETCLDTHGFFDVGHGGPPAWIRRVQYASILSRIARTVHNERRGPHGPRRRLDTPGYTVTAVLGGSLPEGAGFGFPVRGNRVRPRL